jgi:hypothetical protein
VCCLSILIEGRPYKNDPVGHFREQPDCRGGLGHGAWGKGQGAWGMEKNKKLRIKNLTFRPSDIRPSDNKNQVCRYFNCVLYLHAVLGPIAQQVSST